MSSGLGSNGPNSIFGSDIIIQKTVKLPTVYNNNITSANKNVVIDPSGNVGVLNGTTPGVVIPSTWNSNYVSLLKNSSTSRVSIGIIGDSVTAGCYASNQMPNTAGKHYISILASSLQKLYGDGGSGFISAGSSLSLMNAAVNGTPYASSVIPVAFSGGFSNASVSASLACTAANFISSTTSGSNVSMYARGSQIVIYYWIGSSGYATFNWSIATRIGGTVVASGTINANTGSNANIQTETVLSSSLISQEYTVTLTSTINGSFNVIGAAGFNPTGIVVNNFGFNGMKMSIFDTPTVTPNNWAYSGGYASTTLQSNLIIFVLNLNDASSTPSTWSTSLFNAMTQWVQNQTILQNYIFLSIPLGEPTSSFYASPQVINRETMSTFAILYNALFLDLNVIISNNSYLNGISLGYWAEGVGPSSANAVNPGPSGTTPSNSNPVHPGDIGHNLIAQAVIPYLLTTSP